MTVIFEPASAIAAAICIAARTLQSTARHSRPCGWCDYSVDDLRRMVDDFNEWAGYDERRRTYRQFDASRFQGLTRSEQAARVLAAQAFEPVDPSPPPSADAADPLPAFLRGTP